MSKFAVVTVIGRDRTGVVATVTSYLFEQGGNVEALEEQVTRGEFSMTVQVSWKADHFRADLLKRGLDRLGRELGMEVRMRLIEPGGVQRFALLVTREDQCPEAVFEAVAKGRLKAKVAVMVSNRTELRGLAKKYGVPFVHVDWTDRVIAEKRVLEKLEAFEVDFVVLARFMKILSPNFVWRYKNKIINIHPSLLPSFPGAQAYRQAYERGVKIVGVTAHFVTMNLDEGPIIAQDSFRVRPGEGLKEIVARGQKLEAALLVKAVNLYLNKRLDVYWGIVKEV